MSTQAINHKPVEFVDRLFSYFGLKDAVEGVPVKEVSDTAAGVHYAFQGSDYSRSLLGTRRGSLCSSITGVDNRYLFLELQNRNDCTTYTVSARLDRTTGMVDLSKSYRYYSWRGDDATVEATVPLKRLRGADVVERMIYSIREAAGLRHPNRHVDYYLSFTIYYFAPADWKDPLPTTANTRALKGTSILVVAGLLLGLATAAYFLWRPERSRSQ